MRDNLYAGSYKARMRVERNTNAAKNIGTLIDDNDCEIHKDVEFISAGEWCDSRNRYDGEYADEIHRPDERDVEPDRSNDMAARVAGPAIGYDCRAFARTCRIVATGNRRIRAVRGLVEIRHHRT